MSGFTYSLDPQRIEEWRRLSVSEQLAVIEEFMRFNAMVSTDVVKETQAEYRKAVHDTGTASI